MDVVDASTLTLSRRLLGGFRPRCCGIGRVRESAIHPRSVAASSPIRPDSRILGVGGSWWPLEAGCVERTGCQYVHTSSSLQAAPAARLQTQLYCVDIVTGTSGNNDGRPNVVIQSQTSRGFLLEFRGGFYQKGATVLQQCFSEDFEVLVQNPSSNAWTRSISWSTEGGLTYANGFCTTCDPTGVTAQIVVDGNADSGDQASVRCFNGKQCVVTQACLQRSFFAIPNVASNAVSPSLSLSLPSLSVSFSVARYPDWCARRKMRHDPAMLAAASSLGSCTFDGSMMLS